MRSASKSSEVHWSQLPCNLCSALDGWHDAPGLLEAEVRRDKVGEDQGDGAREGDVNV